MKSLNEHLNERKIAKIKDPKYKIYLSTYSDVIDEISDYVKKNGYEYDEDDFLRLFQDAFNKPKPGKTYKVQLPIYSGSKEVGIVNAQIYNRGEGGNTYELNIYVS